MKKNFITKCLKNNRPQNAIILAAGFGLRMVPVNMNIPKALLKVKGETLIERLIKQLQEKSIDKIYIIVGFQREKFEYLIDKYNVTLIVNPEYGIKNNLHSLSLASNYLGNSYIIPCDIYSKENPFSEHELYSYYLLTDKIIKKPEFRVNRNMEIVKSKSNEEGNRTIGISYISTEDSIYLKENLNKLKNNKLYDNSFWEEALFKKNKMIISAKIVDDDKIIEIDTYKDLYKLDSDSVHLKSEAIETIKKVLKINVDEIEEIKVLKKGMTNRSFLFDANGKKYIMRIPGEGTDKLINRREESEVYSIINHKNICDDVIYINPENGYKITEFIPNGHSCDFNDINELKQCMEFLKQFHRKKLKVNHEFKVFEKINFYESLWNSIPSAYPDYLETKKNVFSLEKYIEENIEEKILTHIDAVPDNFLIVEKDGKKQIRLLDWEYASMQDPHIDIAMFSIYALYNREEIDNLIDIYFDNKCDKKIRIKIYAYVAACGLLWSNWCEYKRNLGVEFGEYSLKQYRYAKEFYRIFREEILKLGEL